MWRSQRPAWLAFINSHKGNKGSKTFHFNSVRHASRNSHKSAIFFSLCQGHLYHLLHARCYCYPCLSGELFLFNIYSSLSNQKKSHCNASSSHCKSNANIFIWHNKFCHHVNFIIPFFTNTSLTFPVSKMWCSVSWPWGFANVCLFPDYYVSS